MKNRKRNKYAMIRMIMGLTILVFGFSFVSCLDEHLDNTGVNPDEAMVKLTITVPGASLPKSNLRSTMLMDPEYGISDIRLLVFSESNDEYKFWYMVEGHQITQIANNPQRTSFSANLKTSNEPFKLLVVANAGEVFNSYKPTYGIPEEEVREKIKTAFTIDYPDGLPMYGEKIISSLNAEEVNIIDLTMLRSVARIDVEVDLNTTDSKDFVLDRVYIYRANTQLQVIPDASALSDAQNMKVLSPSVPASSTQTKEKYYKTVINPGEVAIRQLYLSESEPVADISSDYQKATCIVVGGYYNGSGELSFYRADFNPGLEGYPIGQVLRNYQYQFIIKSVNSPGWETPDEAADNRATIIGVEIKTWENFTMEMYSDGDNYLGIGSRDVRFAYKKDLKKSVKVESTVPYKISWEGKDETVGVHGGVISNEYFSAEIVTYPTDPGETSHIVFTTLQENTSTIPLVSQLKVNYAGWTFYVKVTQSYYSEQSLRSVRVLSAHAGSTGNLGGLLPSTADALPLRFILSNPDNFSPNGTIGYLSGFSFNVMPTQEWFKQASETNEYGKRLKVEIFSADVIYLANDNYCSSYAAGLVMEWLQSSPNRVLIVGGDGNATSNGLIRPDYNGLLVDQVDWYYNRGVLNEYRVHTPSIHPGDVSYFNFLLFPLNDRNRDFLDGPFGRVDPDIKYRCEDRYFGFAKSYNTEDIIPLMYHEKGEEGWMSFGVDTKRRIFYLGDASTLQRGTYRMSGGPTTYTEGIVYNEADKFWANVWAWIAYQVIWGDEDEIKD